MRVAIADHGAGNVSSVAAALERAGAKPFVTTDPGAVLEAPLALVAGVGHVETASRSLAATGLDDALRERAARGRPVFGICVGMQLLFEDSEEGGSGLGLLRGPVRRLRARRVPHMGWNELSVAGTSRLLEGLDGADAYFAHGYAAEPELAAVAATTEHDGPIAAAVELGAVAGVQFHPERSAAAGALLLRNLVAWSRSA